jgi:diaminopimelate epimerase
MREDDSAMRRPRHTLLIRISTRSRTMFGMDYALMSGAGNLFAVFDGFEQTPPDHPSEVARAVCAPQTSGGIAPRPDGILLLLRPTSGGDCRMQIYNADGSRPETCGNGLRCIAKLAFDRGHVKKTRFAIETDAGTRDTEVALEKGSVVSARVHMGSPRVVALEEKLAIDASSRSMPRSGSLASSSSSGEWRATLVDMGNPHCVLFVDDERAARVEMLGPALEHHARFPTGTNVEFLALRREGAHLRVWERGVGETQACGSGACAAAAAAVARGLARWPMRLHLPGGILEVASDGKGGVFLSGPVETLSTGQWVASRAAQSR